jgi:hypothetical protein
VAEPTIPLRAPTVLKAPIPLRMPLGEGSSQPRAAFSPGVAPFTALCYPPSHYLAGDRHFLGASVDRSGISRGCEKLKCRQAEAKRTDMLTIALQGAC